MNEEIMDKAIMDEAMKGKHMRLMDWMGRCGRQDVCLAFSGGVDSSLLLRMAVDAAQKYGSNVYAVTFHTRLHPPCDLETARDVAKELGGIHTVIAVDELEQEAIRTNPEDRCYLCKRHLFTKLKEFAALKGVSLCMDGTNEDDLHMYRPGIRALKELGVESPLARCHVTKGEVKALAASYGISVASRPSTPCMATRLPYGATLDYGVLDRIARGEAYLKESLEGNVRLRLHGDVARLEVDLGQMARLLDLREEVLGRLKSLGFPYVTLDLEGFRSGSMDLHLGDGRRENR